MKEPADILGRARVASPCGVSWDSMEGGGRVRLCRLCGLNVYDISELNATEAEALLLKTEGRLCGRLTRRADGTVLTKDCPVGLRALRRRAARAAGVAFAALLSLCSLALGQTKAEKLSCGRCGEVTVERKQTTSETASLSGVVVDPNGAVVAGGDVVLRNEATKKEFRAQTSDEGRFSFARLPAGAYTFEVSWPGFKPLSVKRLKVGAGEDVSVRASLVVAEETMGIILTTSDAAPPDFEGGGGKKVLLGRVLTDPPLPPR